MVTKKVRSSININGSELHRRDLVRQYEFCLGRGDDLFNRNTGPRLHQSCPPFRKCNHGHLADDEIDRPYGGQRQSTFVDNFWFAFRGVLHGDDDTLCPGHQVHGTAHAGHHLSRDHPVRQQSFGVDLEGAKHGHVDVPATNEGKRHGAVERARARQRSHRPSACIRQQRVRHPFFRDRPSADQAILGLKEDFYVVRDEICYHRWDSNPEIDQHSGSQFERYALRDNRLRVHCLHPFATM